MRVSIYLVAVPPSIVDSHSSNDLVVREKELVNLTCEAQGYPQPQILWRREDGRPIMASGMARDKGDQLAGGYKAVAVIFGFTQTQEFANVVGSQQV